MPPPAPEAPAVPAAAPARPPRPAEAVDSAPPVEEIPLTAEAGAPIIIPAPKGGWPGGNLFVIRSKGLTDKDEDRARVGVSAEFQYTAAINPQTKFFVEPIVDPAGRYYLRFYYGSHSREFYRVNLDLQDPPPLTGVLELPIPGGGSVRLEPGRTTARLNEELVLVSVTPTGRDLEIGTSERSWFQTVEAGTTFTARLRDYQNQGEGLSRELLYIPAVRRGFQLPYTTVRVETSKAEFAIDMRWSPGPCTAVNVESIGSELPAGLMAAIAWKGNEYPLTVLQGSEPGRDPFEAYTSVGKGSVNCAEGTADNRVENGTLPADFNPDDSYTIILRAGGREIARRKFNEETR